MTESRDSEQVSPEQRLRKALENRDAKAARRILDAMHDADIAAVLAETAVEGERSRIWDLLPYKRWEGITGLSSRPLTRLPSSSNLTPSW